MLKILDVLKMETVRFFSWELTDYELLALRAQYKLLLSRTAVMTSKIDRYLVKRADQILENEFQKRKHLH